MTTELLENQGAGMFEVPLILEHVRCAMEMRRKSSEFGKQVYDPATGKTTVSWGEDRLPQPNQHQSSAQEVQSESESVRTNCSQQ